MLRTTTNFDTANALKQKQPVWIVDFDGIATKFSSGEFGDITGSYKKYLKTLTIKPMKIDLLKFHTEFFGITFTIIEDSVDTILGIINANTMGRREVTVKVGFQSLDLADFAEFPVCLIEDIEYKIDGNEWVFSARHPYNQIKRPIFAGLGKTELTADETTGSTTYNVSSTTGFTTAGVAPWSLINNYTYIQVGSEIILYSATAATTFTVPTATDRYGENTDHANGENVYEAIGTDDEIAQFLLWILTTTAAGTNGNYDLGLASWGMGIDVDFVDTNQILNEIGFYGKWEMLYDFLFTPQGGIEDGFKWIEENILSFLPGFLFLTEENKLGVKVWDVYGNSEGDYTIDQDSTVGSPQLKSKEKNIVTHIELEDNVALSGKLSVIPDLHDEYECDLLDTEYGEVKRIKVSLSSDRVYPTYTGLAGDQQIQAAQRFFGRMGLPIGEVKIKTFLEHQIVQGGDLINLTHDKLPLFRTGARGWTNEAVQTTNVTVNYRVGQIQPEMVMDNILNSATVDLQDVNIVSQAQIDETSIGKDADHAAGTLQAVDGYYDNTTYTATDIMVEIDLIQPGNAGGQNNRYITLYVKIQNPAGTDVEEREVRFYYDERESTTRTAQFYVQDLTAAIYARVRVDWTATSGGTEPSSVDIKKIKFWHFKSTITKTGI